ncbi:MAG: hypothetical protein ACLS3B_03820 [Veillonella atypica]|uniref:hypothetical protein n=1 Tax=Veillonella atypica TaxID=39777 RepID=UPI003991355B
MAEWSNATMTDVGADLQAKVNAGKTKLTFTKIKVGSGVNATNSLALTDVISSKWETTNFVVKQEGKIVSVDTFITNNGITEAFRMSEIGLFAQDPDKGEVLYAYLTDPEPDRMPAEGGSVVVSQELTIGMVFSNTGNVSLTVNMGALVTHEQLEQHNEDATAHDKRFNDIIKKVDNMLTTVDNADGQPKAPTLALVKTLLSGLNIKNATDVVNALESEKATGLGIRYDFSNVNAWYICLGKLFGNLIIQGGKFVPEIASITFPIRFNEVLAVLPMMLDEPTPWHEMMIRPKAITASTFKMVSGSSNTNYPKSRNNGCWIAVGI